MILHSTLPYSLYIPNPTLGYLKGFLQEREITVRNIYWNLLLAETILDFQRNLEKYTRDERLSSTSAITFFLCKHFLTERSEKSGETTLDLQFSAIFPKREISNLVSSVKSQIDQYIKQNNLDKEPFSGFDLRTYQWPMSYYIIRRLKALNPAAKIAVYGTPSKAQALQFIRIFSLTDFVIWGEIEYPLSCLVDALEKDTSLGGTPNLMYRNENEIRSTDEGTQYPDLDSYPFADHSDYFATFEKYINTRMPILVPIEGSRYCPWNKCKFCISDRERIYRIRSPENIVEEIEYQAKRHNVDNFVFVDSELAGNKKRFKTFLNLLVESSKNRKRPFHFFAEVSPVFFDLETVPLMQLAFFDSIQIGFEAMTDALLEKMQKRHRFAHNIQALKLGDQNSLNLEGLNILRDIPTETENDIVESCINLKFLRFLLNKYSLSLISLRLCKDSPFYDEMTEGDKKSWNSDLLWEEIASTNLVSESDRFELSEFCIDSPAHYHAWNIFDRVLTSYIQQNRSYAWVEYPDSSFVEEKGPRILRYTFDRDETDILIFCDRIRDFSELRTRFHHLSEDELFGILNSLKEAGFLYYDRNFHTIISVLEAAGRRRANP